jgi:hypothetical protein
MQISPKTLKYWSGTVKALSGTSSIDSDPRGGEWDEIYAYKLWMVAP